MCSCCTHNRFQGLQRVLVSIGVTLVPLLNTFVIYIIINSICAVLAAQFFGKVNDELFGSFFKVCLLFSFAAFEFCRYALRIQLLTMYVLVCLRARVRARVRACTLRQTWLTMVQVSTGDGWMTDVLRPLMDQGADTR